MLVIMLLLQIKKKMSSNITYVLFFLILCYSSAHNDRKFFRRDYKYVESTQAFYKFHTTPKNWTSAYQACTVEGANFFYPENADEAHAVLNHWNETLKEYGWIFVAISDLIAEGYFETVDGVIIEQVYNKWSSGEPSNTGPSGTEEDCVEMNRYAQYNDDSCSRKLPYFCKKSLSDLKWDTLCDIPSLDYTYDHASKNRCYKVHRNAKTWADAYVTCIGEQCYLAVIDSDEESNLLVNLTMVELDIENDWANKTIHVGYHNRLGIGWKTTTGLKLDKINYNVWAEGQPDGHNHETEERCGAMSGIGLLHDITCDTKSSFICEHEIDLDNSQDYLSTPQPQ